MTLNGGTFNTAGLSEHGASNNTAGIGALTLQSSSIIDMANGASIIAFADSHTASWSGTLKIYDWTGTVGTGNGTDQLYIGANNTTQGLTSAQLSDIIFYSDAGITQIAGGNYSISRWRSCSRSGAEHLGRRRAGVGGSRIYAAEAFRLRLRAKTHVVGAKRPDVTRLRPAVAGLRRGRSSSSPRLLRKPSRGTKESDPRNTPITRKSVSTRQQLFSEF